MNLLNWPHWDVLNLHEPERAYELTAALKQRATTGVQCGVLGQLERFGKQHPVFLDLPVHGKQVAIRVERQRYRCTACGRTFLEPLPDMDEGHAATTRLVYSGLLVLAVYTGWRGWRAAQDRSTAVVNGARPTSRTWASPSWPCSTAS